MISNQCRQQSVVMRVSHRLQRKGDAVRVVLKSGQQLQSQKLSTGLLSQKIGVTGRQ